MEQATPPIQGCIVRLPKVVSDPEPEIRFVSWEEIETLFPVFLQVQGVYQWIKRMGAMKKQKEREA